MRSLQRSILFVGFIAIVGWAQQSTEVTGWRMQDSSTVGSASGATISGASYDASSWYAATVPGTVLGTLVDRGVYSNPYYGKNMISIPDLAAQQKRYWFRSTFNVTFTAGQRVWLELGGINYKAVIYVNGTQVGTMYGAFKEAKFDITANATSGANCVAVKIQGNLYPGTYHTKESGACGPNGGVMSRDGPTFISSQSWDWAPTVPDRDMGIWKPVYIRVTGPVVLRHPWIRTTNVSSSSATVPLQVTLENSTAAAVSGTVNADVNGSTQFTAQTASVPANGSTTVTFPNLTMNNPQLWWPNGYGAPNLYACHISFTPTGAAAPSDTLMFNFGVRQYAYSTSSGSLIISCNGQRILARGGNWGMDEVMKRWDLHRLEAQVRYHKEMNFNVIRDWIGGTDREPFYDLCDRYGQMVWSDFWEPHSADQPVPVDDQANFIANMQDKILRVRNHACVVVWCARNETTPTPAFLTALTGFHNSLDGTRRVQSSSGADGVHSGGPYTYTSPANCLANLSGFHTEFGGPTVMSYESMAATFPAADLYAMSNTNSYWAFHDYCQGNGYPMNYTSAMSSLYGSPTTGQQCGQRGQLMNYDDYRAYLESLQAKRFNGATGLLLWMSNCVWPSLMWQTYDYYLEGTGAMYGSQKGSEAIHVMYYGSTNVTVINNTMQALTGYTVSGATYNLNGTQVWKNSQVITVGADATGTAFPVTPGSSTPYFLDLKLKDASGNLVSKNFYWLPNSGTNISGMLTMGQAAVAATANATWTRNGEENTIRCKLANTGTVCAVACRLMLTRGTGGVRILPVHFNDNYFSLAPGDTQDVVVKFDEVDRAGTNPQLCVTGINVPQSCVTIGGVVPVVRRIATVQRAGMYATLNGKNMRIANVASGSAWNLTMFNMEGQTVLNSRGVGNGEVAYVSAASLRPGIYVATLRTEGDVFRSMVTISEHGAVR